MRLKKRDGVPGATLVLLAVALYASSNQYRANPSYEGKRISDWLEDCDIDNTKLSNAAEAAVRGLGVDAMPFILAMLERRDSPLKHRIMRNCVEFRALGLKVTSAYLHQCRAAAACRVLGPEAKAAIPALTALTRAPLVNRAAGEALAAIGPEAMSALIAQLTNGMALNRRSAAAALSQFGTNAAPAIGPLATAAEDPDAEIRATAVLAFEKVASNGEPMAISALVKRLDDKEPTVRKYAVTILGSLGRHAVVAIPALKSALSDSNPEVRRIASLVLKALDAQAVSSRGI